MKLLILVLLMPIMCLAQQLPDEVQSIAEITGESYSLFNGLAKAKGKKPEEFTLTEFRIEAKRLEKRLGITYDGSAEVNLCLLHAKFFVWKNGKLMYYHDRKFNGKEYSL